MASSASVMPARACDLPHLTPSPALVSIMGVVVDVSGNVGSDDGESLEGLYESFQERRRKQFVYTVDDGTGVLTVFHHPLEAAVTREKCIHVERAMVEAPKLQRLTAITKAALVNEMCGFKIGTCVEVVGKFHLRKQDTIVLADSIREVQDPNYEIDRILATGPPVQGEERRRFP